MSGLVVGSLQKVLDVVFQMRILLQEREMQKSETLSFGLIDRVLLGR